MTRFLLLMTFAFFCNFGFLRRLCRDDGSGFFLCALPSLSNITNLIGHCMATYNFCSSRNIATELFTYNMLLNAKVAYVHITLYRSRDTTASSGMIFILSYVKILQFVQKIFKGEQKLTCLHQLHGTSYEISIHIKWQTPICRRIRSKTLGIPKCKSCH
jgi:hypothetical protein